MPSTKHGQMPWDRGAAEDVQLMLSNCVQFIGYHLSQGRAVPMMLRRSLGREERIEWLMVSKASVRSRRMRMFSSPESEERKRSLVPLRGDWRWAECCSKIQTRFQEDRGDSRQF